MTPRQHSVDSKPASLASSAKSGSATVNDKAIMMIQLTSTVGAKIVTNPSLSSQNQENVAELIRFGAQRHLEIAAVKAAMRKRPITERDPISQSSSVEEECTEVVHEKAVKKRRGTALRRPAANVAVRKKGHPIVKRPAARDDASVTSSIRGHDSNPPSDFSFESVIESVPSPEKMSD